MKSSKPVGSSAAVTALRFMAFSVVCSVAVAEVEPSPAVIAVPEDRVELVYETGFDHPEAIKIVNEDQLMQGGERRPPADDVDWVYEGADRAWVEGSQLHIGSADEHGRAAYHSVLWNARPFPEHFLLEFQFSKSQEKGLNIVFFATQPQEGESIFAPGLEQRRGQFKRYHSGQINGYHVSYWATFPDGRPRGQANLRKNAGFHLVAEGQDRIAGAGPGPHTVRLLKVGPMIVLETDGRVALTWTDEGTHGAPYGGGWIGLRQMQYSGVNHYDYFRVYRVDPDTSWDSVDDLIAPASGGAAVTSEAAPPVFAASSAAGSPDPVARASGAHDSAPATPEAREAAAHDYLALTRAYADTMIEKGRDRYGEVRSPLFATTLDRKTGSLFDQMPHQIRGIRTGDRSWPGANPMHHIQLHRLLGALTQITGEPQYLEASNEALQWFFQHCQSPTTGLMAWGEHMSWDFRAEGPYGYNGTQLHEYFGTWEPLWDRTYELAPEPASRFAQGVWKHHLRPDDPLGRLFNRHSHDTWTEKQVHSRTGKEFPRHGGYYITTWAAAYQHTQDPQMLKAIERVVDYYEKARHAETGLVASSSSNPEEAWPQQMVQLATSLAEAAPRVPDDLAQRMQALAASLDKAYLSLGHDLGPDGNGLIKYAFVATGEAGSPRIKPDASEADQRHFSPYTHDWASGYGYESHAAEAMMLYDRYHQTQDPGYRKLILAAADRYLDAEPPAEDLRYLKPETLSDLVSLNLVAHRISGEEQYLRSADRFANQAVKVFLDGGASALPRCSARLDHYEAMTGGDDLMLAMLALWVEHHRPDADLDLLGAY